MDRDHGQGVGVSVWNILLFEGNTFGIYKRTAMKKKLLVKRKEKDNFLLILNSTLGNPVQCSHISHKG